MASSHRCIPFLVSVLLLSFLLFFGAGITTTAQEKAGKPNIIFILADDLGGRDLGVYGSTYYETPHIDQLAREGVRFTEGYSCGPNCQPTRAALMTGQYAPRTGVYTVGHINRFAWQTRPLRPVDNVEKLPLQKTILPQSLKEAGYATAMFGKWHLGQDHQYHPAKRGFDEAIVSMGQHFDFKTDPPVEVPKDTYLADFLTEKAIDFIRRKKDQPFFLYLPHFGVHSPFQAKNSLIEKFRKKTPGEEQKDPTYAAMIASVDESVGKIMQTLKELGLEENTLVLFSSDNGGVPAITSNRPLRAGKGTLYEGGVRVAYIFRWKGTLPAQRETSYPINSVDLYPTLLEITRAKAPQHPLDGVSYWPVLKNPGGGTSRSQPLFWHFPGYLGGGPNAWRLTPAGAIREGDWKLIQFFETGQTELYHLKKDPSEANNLVQAESQKAQELKAKLEAWQQSIQAPMPTKNDPSAPVPTDKPKKKNQKNKAPA